MFYENELLYIHRFWKSDAATAYVAVTVHKFDQ